MSKVPVEIRAVHSSKEAHDLPAVAGGKPIRSRAERIVFGAPVLGDAEIESVVQCLRSNWIGLGGRVALFEQEFARYKGASYALAVNSGTAALHLALLALGIGPGDEVIVPAMTFCSTVNVIIHTGAKPVLVDCRRDTFDVDTEAIEREITPHTKAIIAVHMCGRCCDMDPIMQIARTHALYVVEDCAHAIEATYRGRSAGLIGDVGCFSFYATKNLTTGDGGMVIGHDGEVMQRAKSLSLHGMTADAWGRFSGGTTGYDVTQAGFKYNMTDMEASLGLPQLARLEERWERRHKAWRLYNQLLRPLPLELPSLGDPDSRHACHLYTPLLALEKLTAGREEIIAALEAENIGAGIHYVPVHHHKYYRDRYGFRDSDYPNATYVGRRTISLPLSPAMSAQDVSDVSSALARILRYYSKSGPTTP